MSARQRAIQLDIAQRYKRERGVIPTGPVEGVEDWGATVVDVSAALAHVVDGLPTGQQNRVVNAALALQSGVSALIQYLDAAGYFSTPDIEQTPYTLEEDGIAKAREARHELTMSQFK